MSPLGTPPGKVTVIEDQTNNLGALTLDSTGSASLSPPTSPGIHRFLATYPGQGLFSPAVSIEIVVVFANYQPSLILQSSANPSLVSQSVTFTATITSQDHLILAPVVLTDTSTNTTLATLTPNASGQATYSTSTLAEGFHSIEANYAGDSTHDPASALVLQQVANGYPTNASLSCSPNPVTAPAPVQLAASVTSASGDPTGTVSFTDNANALASEPLSNGAAGYAANLPVGIHTLIATFIPSASSPYSGSSASCIETVNGQPSTTNLTVTPSTASYGQAVTLSAGVSAASGPVPTGSLAFTSSLTGLIANVNLDSSGKAAYSVSNLPVGAQTITATYSGNAALSTSSASAPLTITAEATMVNLTASPTGAPAFQPIQLTATVSTAQGAVSSAGTAITFTLAGVPPVSAPLQANGSASTTLTNLPPGSYAAIATFPATGAYTGATSQPALFTIVPAQTAVSLTASPNPANQGQTIQFVATATIPGSSATPTGQLVFTALTSPVTTLSTQQLANGSATFSTSTLAPGIYQVVAAFASTSSSLLPSQSAALTVTVQPQNYILTTASPAISIQTQYHKSLGLTLASIGGYTGTIQLSCSNLPQWTSCNFASASMPLAPNATLQSSVDIDTDAVLDYKSALDPRRPGEHTAPIAFAAILPLCLLLGLRRRLPATRRLTLLCALLLAALTAATVSGCSGMYPYHTAPGTYTISVTAYSPADNRTQSVPITLTVTP
jgi:hypothetical protein